MATPFALTRAGTLVRKAAAWCCENPMKLCSATFMLADLFLGQSPVAGTLWRWGAGLGVAVQLNNIVFGKGGDPVEAEAFHLSRKNLKETAPKILSLPGSLLTKAHWQDVAAAVRKQKPDLWKRAARSLQFWRYPLETMWMATLASGALYALDALSDGSLGPYFIGKAHAAVSDPASLPSFDSLMAGVKWAPRWGDTAIGLSVLAGGLTGFFTNDGALAGRVFSVATCLSFATGVVTMNPALVLSSFAFLYANYQMTCFKAHRQSSYVIAQEKAKLG